LDGRSSAAKSAVIEFALTAILRLESRASAGFLSRPYRFAVRIRSTRWTDPIPKSESPQNE
jgi:hypothetical protein